MEATCSSETSVDFQRTTRRFITENIYLHNHRYENMRSYRINITGNKRYNLSAHCVTVISPSITTFNILSRVGEYA
jgi:hypothetical protein